MVKWSEDTLNLHKQIKHLKYLLLATGNNATATILCDILDRK